MIDNKLTGIVKQVSNKNKGILLIYKDNEEELIESWFNYVGGNDEVMKLITDSIRRKEVELTISNIEKRTFSYLRIIESMDNQGKDIQSKASCTPPKKENKVSKQDVQDAFFSFIDKFEERYIRE